METMSQFATKESMWEARAMRFAAALVDFMDGTQDHDIQAETGLPMPDCERISQAREDARTLIRDAWVDR